LPQAPRCSWKRHVVRAASAPSAPGRKARKPQATFQRRRRAQHDPLLAGDDVGDLVDRHDEQVPTHASGPDGERVRSIHARPEPGLLDEADPSLGRVDPEALAAAEPVIERGRSGWTTLAVHRAHLLLGDPVLLSRGVGARSWPTQERLRPRCGTHRVPLARRDRVPNRREREGQIALPPAGVGREDRARLVPLRGLRRNRRKPAPAGDLPELRRDEREPSCEGVGADGSTRRVRKCGSCAQAARPPLPSS